MTHLVLEAGGPLTRLEVKDWLYKIGCIAYEVKPIPDVPPSNGNTHPSNGKNHRFQITTSDAAAKHAVTMPPGQEIGGILVVLRADKTD